MKHDGPVSELRPVLRFDFKFCLRARKVIGTFVKRAPAGMGSATVFVMC